MAPRSSGTFRWNRKEQRHAEQQSENDDADFHGGNCIPRVGAIARNDIRNHYTFAQRWGWQSERRKNHGLGISSIAKESWRTTWKLRLSLLVLVLVIVPATRRFWAPHFASTLTCTQATPNSDALLLENFDPDYLVFERAETLLRAGIASRVFVPAPAGAEGEPKGVEKGIVDMMARIARLPKVEIIPIRVIEPISLNAAVDIRDALVKEQIHSIVVVAPGFRSQRSALVYSTVLEPANIQVSCEPVFGLSTGANWTESWHGLQLVLEQFGKLQYYRFWVLPWSKS